MSYGGEKKLLDVVKAHLLPSNSRVKRLYVPVRNFKLHKCSPSLNMTD